jgi:hypothetical protein
VTVDENFVEWPPTTTVSLPLLIVSGDVEAPGLEAGPAVAAFAAVPTPARVAATEVARTAAEVSDRREEESFMSLKTHESHKG